MDGPAHRRPAHRARRGTSSQRGARPGFHAAGGRVAAHGAHRAGSWLAELGDCNGPVGAVTHKGVIRAALSLATGWDLTADFGQKLARDALHVFRIDDGALAIRRLNVPL
ncbi:MAG: histidine phosphatase family protein [Gammaproteobacteria bacterium]|nr:histidine phosphatase family protein [Gammaproteobacteria bacterium]